MRRYSRGSILILALWSVSVLAILAVTLGAGTRQKLTLLRRLESVSTLQFAAQNGVEKARAVLREPDLTEKYDALNDAWARNPGMFKDVPESGASYSVGEAFFDRVTETTTMEYGLIDEERKLNMNTADSASILRLLKMVSGIKEEDDALAIAHAIVDWRDSDSAYGHPQYGAEDDDYKSLDMPYEAKDAPYEAFEELLLVKGMSRAIFDKIRPFVTIYGSGGVNINTAPFEVLVAVGLDEALAVKIIKYRAGSDGVAGTPDDLYFTSPESVVTEIARLVPVNGAEEAALASGVDVGSIRTSSENFEVISRARLDSGRGEIEIRAVINRRGKVHSYRVSKVQWPERS